MGFPTLLVEVAFTGTAVSNYVWTDISADVRSMSTSRGRQRQIEAFAAGTCTIELDNNLGDYDPDNPGSAYANGSSTNPVTNVLPLRPVRVTATWDGVTYPIFYGYADSWTPQYAPGQYSDAWCVLSASDGMKLLNSSLASGAAPAGETSDARIIRILDSVGWEATLRDIASGDTTLQNTTLVSSAAQEIQTTVDSEYGRWYMGADGKVIFENRSSRGTSQTPVATWSDTNTDGLLYAELGRTVDDDLIRNSVTAANVGGTNQTLTDAASILKYGTHSYQTTGLLLQADTDAYQIANLILYQGKELAGARFDGITFEPVTSIAAGDSADLWPEVLGRAISDRVAIVVTPPYVSPMTMGAFVEGVSHRVTTSPRNWTTTFHASRSSVTQFLIFNDATYGTIGTTNTFGY